MKPADDLRAGDLNQRITLSGPVAGSQNDEPAFGVLASNIPAEKRALQGREVLASGRDVSEQWAEWRIRYRPDLSAANHLSHGSDEYNIESIADRTGGRRVQWIMARVVR